MDRILVTEKISAEGLEALKKDTVEVDVRLDLDKERLQQVISEYDALVVRSATKVTADIIAAGSRLRVIGRAGSGVDNIDVEAATQRGIIVVNAPASNNVAVAELTIGLMLSLARMIPQAHLSLQNGEWKRNQFMGWEVRDKTLGLVGLGRIGSEVARRARGLQMQVLAYDPIVSFDRASQLGVECVTLDDLLSRSDIISLHVPLVDETRNMFHKEVLARMKPGASIINASRGGIVNEADLLAAIESGHLAGAALDVYSKEPPVDRQVFGHPRILTTPHLGASTVEAQALTGTDVAEGVLVALEGGTPRYAVNAPFVAPEAWGVLQPYIGLGQQMGTLCRQLIQSPIGSYEITYLGELAEVDILPVRLAVLQGILTGTADQRITPVNAPLIARERGVAVVEHSDPQIEGYTGMLILRAMTASGIREFRGTILRGEPHVVQADGYWVMFVASGKLLFTYHNDRPGLIGRVGTILGAADVNISAMYVGRQAPRKRAMMVLALDDTISAEALERIRAEPDIEQAYTVTLS
ncbi:MAG: phosphoglycerate dehydrogenase [Chloroflexaceae bacterium]|nr:phosphoglycerate dehydrogenase [Chloroflexaceae bacterium]